MRTMAKQEQKSEGMLSPYRILDLTSESRCADNLSR